MDIVYSILASYFSTTTRTTTTTTTMEESSASESFEAYAAEFQSLLSSSDKRDDTNSNAVIISQCHDLLQQMVVEARGVSDPHSKRELLDRHRAYKSQWQVAQQETERDRLLLSSSLASASSNQQQHHQQQQKLLRDGEETLTRQNATLVQASRTMKETEEMASEIVGHLSDNRETLERCRANTKEVGTMTARANQIATNLLKPWWRKGI